MTQTIIIALVEILFFLSTVVGFVLLLYAYLDASRTERSIHEAERELKYKAQIKPEHIIISKLHTRNQLFRLIGQVVVAIISGAMVSTSYPRDDWVVMIIIILAVIVMLVLAAGSVYEHIYRKKIIRLMDKDLE